MVGMTATSWVENLRSVVFAEGLSPDKLIPGGAKLDAAQFLAEDGTAVTLSAAALVGATSLAVTALPKAVPSGTILDFGARAAQVVTAGAAIATATTLPVTALTAGIAAGTDLYFGTNKFAHVTAAAAAGATSLTVAALPTALAGAETATVPASSIVAKTAANAAAAATSITVEALAEPIPTASVATYAGAGTLKKRVPEGTLIGRTYTERDAGTGFGPWASGDDDVFLVAFAITDAAVKPDVELVSHGTKVYETNVPGWVGSSAGFKTAVRAAYQTMIPPAH